MKRLVTIALLAACFGTAKAQDQEGNDYVDGALQEEDRRSSPRRDRKYGQRRTGEVTRRGAELAARRGRSTRLGPRWSVTVQSDIVP